MGSLKVSSLATEGNDSAAGKASSVLTSGTGGSQSATFFAGAEVIRVGSLEQLHKTSGGLVKYQLSTVKPAPIGAKPDRLWCVSASRFGSDVMWQLS